MIYLTPSCPPSAGPGACRPSDPSKGLREARGEDGDQAWPGHLREEECRQDHEPPTRHQHWRWWRIWHAAFQQGTPILFTSSYLKVQLSKSSMIFHPTETYSKDSPLQKTSIFLLPLPFNTFHPSLALPLQYLSTDPFQQCFPTVALSLSLVLIWNWSFFLPLPFSFVWAALSGPMCYFFVFSSWAASHPVRLK